jgi:hypothetical protein
MLQVLLAKPQSKCPALVYARIGDAVPRSFFATGRQQHDCYLGITVIIFAPFIFTNFTATPSASLKIF